MFLFDTKTSDRIQLIDFKFDVFKISNHRGRESEISVIINDDIENYSWIMSWIQDSRYKRDIYINTVQIKSFCSGNQFKFIDTLPINLECQENTLKVSFISDFYKSGQNFPELTQIFREHTIDRILN